MSDYSNAARINYDDDYNSVEIPRKVFLDPQINIEKYVGYFADLWNDCRNDKVEYGPVYSQSQKISREKDINKFFDAVKKEANKNGFNEKQNLRNYEKFSPAIRTFLKEGLNFSSGEIDLFFSHDFLKITSQFIESARIFDSALSPEEIFQACRNVWAMNWMQVFLNKPVELTPSVFAYSLLYPYTDNYIDGSKISFEEKIDFNERLYLRLQGENVEAKNPTEKTIYKLIGMIESQFDRQTYPGVYESLLAIHAAQIKSLELFDEKCHLTKDEILLISIEKGGTSVLADGYLVAGNLMEKERMFLFGYGAYLQLVDDIQDVAEDSKSKVSTIYSYKDDLVYLDNLIDRTYKFGERILSGCDLFEVIEKTDLFEIMKKGSKLLLIVAVGLSSDYYSSLYVNKMELHSPFNFGFIRKNQKYFFDYGMQLLK